MESLLMAIIKAVQNVRHPNDILQKPIIQLFKTILNKNKSHKKLPVVLNDTTHLTKYHPYCVYMELAFLKKLKLTSASFFHDQPAQMHKNAGNPI